MDRARLERIFGDVFPDTTADEREPGAGSSSGAAGDEWLRRQRPPHHG
ncbi:hypothetical protein Rhow_001669 [Rhodococcus wratislaviensis]|uniref:Uncharacterized protein n=1 Tax=Rhodococcus wratislaviensis TaxID=44752 RepID=A0A402BY16_RHOWR|nr:hypothetical protein [Rhodococcus wratislaviensis]GCE36303.1 hypothetical protein Rhow_001669 [Rhodococcus wratislaviensis]